MSIELSADEVRQSYIAAMGSELGPLCFELWNECVLLYWKWEEYVTLFGTSPRRINLLNDSAGAFFRIVQDSLWEDILLHISRLTDPPRSSGKDNLTLQRLARLVEDQLQPPVRTLLTTCSAACAFARDWRMRRIAHRDLALALEISGISPLAPASRAAVTSALVAIAKVLNAVELHYRHSETMFELRPLGNAEALLHVLQKGLKAETERRDRIMAGKYTPEDLKHTQLP